MTFFEFFVETEGFTSGIVRSISRFRIRENMSQAS